MPISRPVPENGVAATPTAATLAMPSPAVGPTEVATFSQVIVNNDEETRANQPAPPDYDSLKTTLEGMRAKWATLGIHDYEIEVEYGSVWVSLMHIGGRKEPAVLTVEGDQIVAVRSLTNTYPFHEQSRQSVATLFDFADNAIAGEPDGLIIEYDPTYGYPTQIFINPSLPTYDDEYNIRARNLVLR
jgi:hypothetical protein